MNQERSNTELIDLYLKGKLTASETQVVEERLNSDIIFLKEFKIQKALYYELEKLGDKQVKTDLDYFHGEFTAEQAKTPSSLIMLFVVLLSMMLGTLIYLFTIPNEDYPAKERIKNKTAVKTEKKQPEPELKIQKPDKKSQLLKVKEISESDTIEVQTEEENILVEESKSEVFLQNKTYRLFEWKPYPKPLYIFSKSQGLFIYGWHDLDPKKMKIIKDFRNNYLQYNNTLYPITYTNNTLSMKPNGRGVNTDLLSNPFNKESKKMTVTLVDSIIRYTQVDISMTENQSNDSTYSFQNNILSLPKSWLSDTASLYVLKENENFINLFHKNHVYKLKEGTNNIIPEGEKREFQKYSIRKVSIPVFYLSINNTND